MTRETLGKKLEEALERFNETHNLPHLSDPLSDLVEEFSTFDFDDTAALSTHQLAAAG